MVDHEGDGNPVLEPFYFEGYGGLPIKGSGDSTLAAVGAEGDAETSYFVVSPNDWEPIKSDYSNIRAVFFVPTYPSLISSPPGGTRDTYEDVASHVAFWRFYQPLTVVAQLDLVKRLGFNAVRLPLSFPIWDWDDDLFRSNVLHFFSKCEERKIYVIPVFWHGFSPEGLDPSGEPFEDIAEWRRSPGSSNLSASWIVANTANQYVSDVVGLVNANDYRCVLMWDVMDSAPDTAQEFLSYFVDQLKGISSLPVTIGFDSVYNLSLAVLQDIDVISFKPFGALRENIRQETEIARSLNKPVLAIEVGQPGSSERYEHVIQYCSELRLGFVLYGAMIGDPTGNFQRKETSGIFYHDGQVRDIDDALAIYNHSRQQWPPSTAWVVPPIAKSNFTGFQDYMSYLPDRYGADKVIDALDPVNWSIRPMLTDANQNSIGYALQIHNLTVIHNALYRFIGMSILSQDEEAKLQFYQTEYDDHDLDTGSSPWLLPGPVTDWLRYHQHYENWGADLWDMLQNHQFGSYTPEREVFVTGILNEVRPSYATGRL